MSVGVMSAVFKHSASTGSARLVLLAIADNADDDTWSCWPSVQTIGAKARVSEATVHRALKELQKLGELDVQHNAGGHPGMRSDPRYRPNRYTVLVTGTPAVQGSQSDTPGASGEGCHPRSPGVSSARFRGVTGDTRIIKRTIIRTIT